MKIKESLFMTWALTYTVIKWTYYIAVNPIAPQYHKYIVIFYAIPTYSREKLERGIYNISALSLAKIESMLLLLVLLLLSV